MFDKIKLWTRDFEIKKENPLKVKKGSINLFTGEIENEFHLFSIDGEPVEGEKAYFNSEDLFYSVDISKKGLFIEFNPSLVYFGRHNFYTADNYKLGVVAERIKEDLREKGILVDFDNMELSRLDLCKNIEIDYPFVFYEKVFRWLEGKRMNKRNYEGSYSFGNQSREIIFYDKLKELRQEYNIDRQFLGLSHNVNVMRGELRLRSKRVIKRDVEVLRVCQLYDRELYEHLKERFKEILRDLVFRPEKVDFEGYKEDLNYQEALDLLKTFKKMYKRGSFNRFRNYITQSKWFEFLEKIGGVENFKVFLQECGYSKGYISKLIKKTEREFKIFESVEEEIKKENKKGSLKDLYNEVYYKFCVL